MIVASLVDANLWQAARLIGGISGASEAAEEPIRTEDEPGRVRKMPDNLRLRDGAAYRNRTDDLRITSASL